MNAKFLIILCMTLQCAQQIQASLSAQSQASYGAAFQAFDKALNDETGTNNPIQAATYIYNNAGKKSWSEMLKIAKTLNTPEAMAVGMYLSNGNPAVLAIHFPGADITKQGENISFDKLQNALTATPNPSTTPPVQTAQAAVVTASPNATDLAAAKLKSQIEAAKIVYNQYAPGTYTVTA